MDRPYPRFFAMAESRAQRYVRQPARAARLVYEASRKAGGDQARAAFTRSGANEFWERLKALIRMCRAWVAGRYRETPTRSLILALAALVYFVSPIDAIPDFIPVAGLLDDVTVLAFVINSLQRDIDQFREWEESERRTIDAERPAIS